MCSFILWCRGRGVDWLRGYLFSVFFVEFVEKVPTAIKLEGGWGKALRAMPLRKQLFFAASLIYFYYCQVRIWIFWRREGWDISPGHGGLGAETEQLEVQVELIPLKRGTGSRFTTPYRYQVYTCELCNRKYYWDSFIIHFWAILFMYFFVLLSLLFPLICYIFRYRKAKVEENWITEK